MLVTKQNLNDVLTEIGKPDFFAADTETTGLFPYKSDRLFSIILAIDRKAWYFNFKQYDGLDDIFVLPKSVFGQLEPIFSNQSSTCFMHNAKFDLAMLAREGLNYSGTVHCTEATARVVYNAHPSYKLDDCLKRDLGLAKDGTVKKYIKDHKLWTEIPLPHKKDPLVIEHYDQVPFGLIVPYGETDGIATFQLGKWQLAKLEEISKGTPSQYLPIQHVYQNEIELTKTLFKMEQRGILTDPVYCHDAFEYEVEEFKKAEEQFFQMSGVKLVDSRTGLKEPFKKVGIQPGKTALGNDSYDKKSIAAIKHPLVDCLMNHRDHYKKATTYYQNFLLLADTQGAIHPNIRQAGTKTGRMSYSEPNLQNLTKEDEPEDLLKPFLVRKSFVPRAGHCFVMIDYDQMEYKLMLDYAGQMDLIELVKNGHDVHQATADLVGVSRYEAKRINFGLLYGMGVDKLASELGISPHAGYELRRKYFAKLPKIQALLRGVKDLAQQRGYIYNWFGRIYHFPNGFGVHAAPNYLIQGGCADIVKIAMNRINVLLAPYKTQMLEQVHDELLFEVPFDELHIVDELKKIMEGVYQYKHLKLTCSVSHSFKSWGDKMEGLPDATRNKVQDQSYPRLETAQAVLG